jgi:hypothetical protein
MKFNSDIDIDVADRSQILSLIDHVAAAMYNVKPPRKHNSGVYVTNIPYNPVYDMASIDYEEAENRGYIKLDLLNVYVYAMVKDEKHLIKLMKEPDWTMLQDKSFVENLIHLNNHYHSLKEMPEPVDSIPRLAMFLAIIRPGKKHLIGKPWKEVAETVWDKGTDGYVYKKSHSLAYSHLVVVHMNLLTEKLFEIKSST